MIAVYCVMFILLVISAYSDLAHHRVYNWVTIPAMLVGLGLRFIFGGPEGLGNSLIGLAIGLAVFFLMFIMGGVGGGDVKLMGAIGALAGYPFVLWAIFYTALIGGVMAISVLIWHGTLWKGIKQSLRMTFSFLNPRRKTEIPAEEVARTVPYGLAIVLGTYCAWFLRGV